VPVSEANGISNWQVQAKAFKWGLSATMADDEPAADWRIQPHDDEVAPGRCKSTRFDHSQMRGPCLGMITMARPIRHAFLRQVIDKC
jgi:hypothetical protein